MWYLLYLLPILSFGILLATGTATTLSASMSIFGLDVLSSSTIYTSLNGIFGSTGVFPLFNSPDMLLYFTYFISVWICHLAVDVLLFIVRWFHSILDGGFKHE
jgi:hypothetical protein